MELIDRKALLAEYDRVHIGEPGKARKLIEDAPEAVVQCRDCKHYDNKEGYKPICHKFEGLHGYPEADDFCSYGERKDNCEIAEIVENCEDCGFCDKN